MTNIDDTRTVYDPITVFQDFDERGWHVCWGLNPAMRMFKTKDEAEKFRADLIRFVEGYK